MIGPAVQDSITKLVGNTPLLRIRLFEERHPGLEVYAKAEWFNPGGSVKDRAALAMIEDGERRGPPPPAQTIIPSPPGNTAMAHARVAAPQGYPGKLVIPPTATAARKGRGQAPGAPN